MKKILLLLMLLPIFSIAQEQGIAFDKAPGWKAIQAKAKAENKHIFVDCYTTWCGPCKRMDAEVYTQKEVGDYYNANFISVKLQLDSTEKDNEYVKGWRNDGEFIAQNYEVKAYPTYLFFDPNGNIVHRFVGGSDGAEFINKAKNSLDPEKQYYTQLNKYKAGDVTPEFLRNMALLAQKAYDMKNATDIANKYLSMQADLLTKENLEFLMNFTQKSSDKGFKVLFDNAEKANAILGKGSAEKLVSRIIAQEESYPVLMKHFKDKTTPPWESIHTILKTKYPNYAEEVFSKSKITFFFRSNDWAGFQQEIKFYMSKYADNLEPGELNHFAWTIFENCKDMGCITEALELSKLSFKGKEDPTYIDTYANLLHKLGKTKEAIEWQKKAIALIPDEEGKKGYQETLAKMEKGEKTWQD